MPSPAPIHSHATISYSEAVDIVSAYAAGCSGSPGSEHVSLPDSLGRVLAEPLVADRAQPPFSRSTRDGFAWRADTLENKAEVIGLLKAGQAWTGAALETGQAVEIMTGAPLLPGADCVVMVEHVQREENYIELLPGRTPKAGDNFIPAGAEANQGAILLRPGVRMGAPHVAAAASVGSTHLLVHQRPRVAILSTGDELVPLDTQPRAFEIRNSNSYSLAAQVLALGGQPIIQPIAADAKEALKAAVFAAAAGCDLLLLSGGVSMGRYDLVEDVLADLGAKFFFTGVRIQPGKPIVFGEVGLHGKLPLFGLPGNPISTMVTFALFVAPLLAALGGERGYAPRFAQACLTEAVSPKPSLRRFLPARLTADANASQVALVPWHGSGDIAGTAQANCLLVVPELEAASSETLPVGSSAHILFL